MLQGAVFRIVTAISLSQDGVYVIVKAVPPLQAFLLPILDAISLPHDVCVARDQKHVLRGTVITGEWIICDPYAHNVRL